VRLPCLANNRVRLLIGGEALFAALAGARQLLLLQRLII